MLHNFHQSKAEASSKRLLRDQLSEKPMLLPMTNKLGNAQQEIHV